MTWGVLGLIFMVGMISSNPGDDRAPRFLLYQSFILFLAVMSFGHKPTLAWIRTRWSGLLAIPIGYGIFLSFFGFGGPSEPEYFGYILSGLILVCACFCRSDERDLESLKTLSYTYVFVGLAKCLFLLPKAFQGLFEHDLSTLKSFTNVTTLLINWSQAWCIPQVPRPTDILVIYPLLIFFKFRKRQQIPWMILSVLLMIILQRKTLFLLAALALPFRYWLVFIPLTLAYLGIFDGGSLGTRIAEAQDQATKYGFYHLGLWEAHRVGGMILASFHGLMLGLGIYLLAFRKIHPVIYLTAAYLFMSFFHPILFRGLSLVLLGFLIQTSIKILHTPIEKNEKENHRT